MSQNEPVLAMSPQGPVAVPQIVTKFAAGRPLRAVWKNEAGGPTFQIGEGSAREFVKWAPAESGIDLWPEVVRLRWAAAFIAVPRVLDYGADEAGAWLATAGLPGRMAVDDYWKRDPATAVRAIGSGLRAMHEQVPVARCPFDWSAETRLEAARARAAAGRIDPAGWSAELRHFGTVERALEVLADVPPVDQPVVCHGDRALPTP